MKLSKSQGNDTILTITDYDCSKASIFILCKGAIDSEGIAKFIIKSANSLSNITWSDIVHQIRVF